MLRTLGASRRQVLRSVLVEAALMGLVASLIGIGFGVLLAIGLNALFKAVGVDLPTAAITIPLVSERARCRSRSASAPRWWRRSRRP